MKVYIVKEYCANGDFSDYSDVDNEYFNDICVYSTEGLALAKVRELRNKRIENAIARGDKVTIDELTGEIIFDHGDEMEWIKKGFYSPEELYDCYYEEHEVLES